MFKHLTIISLTLFISCNLDNKKTNVILKTSSKTITDTMDNEYTLNCRFNSFDKTVSMIFNNTIDTINDCQKKNHEEFLSKQDFLVPEILDKIFEYYKESYPDYYKGWSYGNQLTKQQIEEDLPTPTNAANLKKYIEPISIYIGDKENCEVGTLGIYFECTWDIKNSLGVVIKKWKVIGAGPGEIAFLY